MGAWSSYSGKFDSRLTERVYDLTLNGGADDECSNDGGQWCGRMNFRAATIVVFQDSQGFISSERVDLADADKRWGQVVQAIEGEPEADQGYPFPSDGGASETPSWLED